MLRAKAATVRSVLCVFAIACVVQAPLLADGPQTSTIDGTITDAQGAGLPGVTVTLAGPQNTRREITNAEGDYRFALLQPGNYKVTANLEGLGSAERDVKLDPGQRQDVDLTLQAATSETITVTSEAALISKYDTGAASAIPEEALENVAYASRNYNASVRQMPTLVTRRQENDFQPSVNGGIRTELGVFIDGVDVSMPLRGGELRFQLPSTAITETKMETAGFGAEYGRATNGVMNSTIKTGTNKFHGDFLYIGQNPSWRDEDWLGIEQPDEMINSFEASLGGPIWRDKAWFFASYNEMSDNRLDQTRTAVVYSTSREAEPLIAKANAQPGSRHQLSLTAIDSPSVAVAGSGIVLAGDQYSIMSFPLNNRIQTLTWSFAMTSSAFLEVKGANREEFIARVAFPPAPIVPGASIDSPNGNDFRYIDLNNALRYNGPLIGLGSGFNDLPRDQANGSVTLFEGNHEIKVGVDIQDITFNNLTDIGTEYRGRGFCRECPSGYDRPANKRVYDPSDPISMNSLMSAAYAQDRIEVGDHLTFHLGVRYDEQWIENDVMERVNDYGEWAPRASVVYDINADGKMLVRGSAGRYFRNIGLTVVFQEFTRGNNGANIYNQFLWNPATELYDRFQRRIEPSSSNDVAGIEPYYKDEVSVGFDWQFANNWIFTSRAVVHESDDLYSASLQFDEDGEVFRDLRNWSNNYREYEGLSFQVNRAFRNNWSLQSNLSIGNADGTIESSSDDDNHNEGFGGIEVSTGDLNTTSSPFWDGPMTHDREFMVNIVGLKRFVFGKHDLMTSAFLKYSAGEPWALHPSTTVAHPVSGQTIRTSTFREPRGSQQMEDFWNLNLSVTYQFPIAGSVQGSIGGEVANATNEQAVVRINERTGRPHSSVASHQYPREYRLKVGFRF